MTEHFVLARGLCDSDEGGLIAGNIFPQKTIEEMLCDCYQGSLLAAECFPSGSDRKAERLAGHFRSYMPEKQWIMNTTLIPQRCTGCASGRIHKYFCGRNFIISVMIISVSGFIRDAEGR